MTILSKWAHPWVADNRPVNAELIVAQFREAYAAEQVREAQTHLFRENLASSLIGKRFRTKVEISFDSDQPYSEPLDEDAGTEVWIHGVNSYGNYIVRKKAPDGELERYPRTASLSDAEVANDLEPIE